MKPEPGPLRLSAELLLAARTLPINKSGAANDVVSKSRSQVPLRRPAAPRRILPEKLPPINRAAVEQALSAAEQGTAKELHSEGQRYTVRIVPAVLDTIQRSGLSPDEIDRFFPRLAKVIGSAETLSQLPQIPEMSDLRLYTTILGKPTTVHVFRLVLAVLPERSVVVVVDCFHRQERAI